MPQRRRPTNLLKQLRRYAPAGTVPVLLDQLPPIGSIDSPFRILPFGEVHSTKGNFTVDQESARLTLAQFDEMGIDVVIDYDHQTFKGGAAPAAGWLTELSIEDDGIYGHAEWTPKGREYILNREYRYHSPVILLNHDRRMIGLVAEALTNVPAMQNANPILNSIAQILNSETIMDELLERLVWFLNMPVTSTNVEIIAELEKLLSQLKEGDTQENSQAIKVVEAAIVHTKAVVEALSQQEGTVKLSEVASLIGLDQGADFSTVKGHILALKNPTGVVSREEFTAVMDQLRERDANDRVQEALSQGKITPAQEKWAKDLAMSDPKAFEVYLSQAMPVVPVKERPGYTPAAEPAGAVPDETQVQINSMLGIDAETFEKFGPRMQEA